MLKNKYILLFLLLSSLYAEKESQKLTALFVGTVHNHTLIFKHKRSHFSCHPAGIITAGELIHYDISQGCKSTINKFYNYAPHFIHFSKSLLKVEQKYHIELVKNGKKLECMVMLNSGKSISSELIDAGFAHMQLEDYIPKRAWKQQLKLAQKRAKISEKGIWANKFLPSCFLKAQEIY
jgi:hypothetical protein